MLRAEGFYGIACCVALLYAWFFIQLFENNNEFEMKKKSQLNGRFMRRFNTAWLPTNRALRWWEIEFRPPGTESQLKNDPS